MRRLNASSSRAPATVTLGGSAPRRSRSGEEAFVESAKHARKEVADRADRALRDESLHRFRVAGDRGADGFPVLRPGEDGLRPARGPFEEFQERGRDFARGRVADDGVRPVADDAAPAESLGEPVQHRLPGRAFRKEPVEAHSGLGQRLARGPDLGAEERGNLARRDPHVARRAVISRNDLPRRPGQRRPHAGEVVEVMNADDHRPGDAGGDDRLHRLVPERRLPERQQRRAGRDAVELARDFAERCRLVRFASLIARAPMRSA